MGKTIFDCGFKTKYFDIERINYEAMERKGTAHLISDCHHYILIWTIRDYPMETVGMPGSPFPVKFNYTIFEQCDKHNRSLNSISGEFVFELASGTAPTNNPLGIPYGSYYSLGRNNQLHETVDITFKLCEDYMEVRVKDNH